MRTAAAWICMGDTGPLDVPLLARVLKRAASNSQWPLSMFVRGRRSPENVVGVRRVCMHHSVVGVRHAVSAKPHAAAPDR